MRALDDLVETVEMKRRLFGAVEDRAVVLADLLTHDELAQRASGTGLRDPPCKAGQRKNIAYRCARAVPHEVTIFTFKPNRSGFIHRGAKWCV